jgi:hypothetical protein
MLSPERLAARIEWRITELRLLAAFTAVCAAYSFGPPSALAARPARQAPRPLPQRLLVPRRPGGDGHPPREAA